jgi:hypothetical protein
MLDFSSHATEIAPSATPWYASGAHAVAPPSGSYILVDHLAMLSTASPGLISPVLVLPRADDAELNRLRCDVSGARE